MTGVQTCALPISALFETAQQPTHIRVTKLLLGKGGLIYGSLRAGEVLDEKLKILRSNIEQALKY